MFLKKGGKQNHDWTEMDTNGQKSRLPMERLD